MSVPEPPTLRLAKRRPSSPCLVLGAVFLLLVGVACSSGPSSSVTATSRPAAQPVSVGAVTDISGTACDPASAEVEDASWHEFVYAAWICLPRGPIGAGIMRIGFARSTDGGRTWGAPLDMPGSDQGWDPAVAVAPDGTLYVSFMTTRAGYMLPVVDVSRDDGATFPQSVAVRPPVSGNFGDRDFITAGPHGVAYLTWDYAPTKQYLREQCAPGGSCSFAAGELNAVVQASADYGATWGPVSHVSPGFPDGGADLAPLLLGPGGRIDAVYQAMTVAGAPTYRVGAAHLYFTSSADGGRTWTRPAQIGPQAGSVATTTWWIDGAIAQDAGGTLYITWDTQAAGSDTGWLAYSANNGATWSAPVRVTADATAAPNIVQAAGGQPGLAYVGWLSDSSPSGYAQYLRVYQVGHGWLTKPIRASTQFGRPATWPGDTFGIATLPGTPPALVLTWGSAVSGPSRIYSARITF
jgi:hypothetical protein